MTVRRWSDLRHFLDDAQGVEGRLERRHEWDLGVSAGAAKERAWKGDLEILDKATALIERIEPDLGEIVKPIWSPSVAGSRVVVGDYVTGNPRHMRRRVRGEATGRTVDVFADLTSSCGVDALDLITRGVSIIALLETLQRCGVSVNLSVCVQCSSFTEPDGETVGVIPIESRPLDLSSASFILAHPAFPRNVMYAILERDNGFSGAWSRFGNDDNEKRKYLGLKKSDVYIPASWLHDRMIIDNPQRWVETRVQQALETKEEEIQEDDLIPARFLRSAPRKDRWF